MASMTSTEGHQWHQRSHQSDINGINDVNRKTSVTSMTSTEGHQWRGSGVLLFTFIQFTHCSDASIVDFEQANTG